jgi:hypothetical protein
MIRKSLLYWLSFVPILRQGTRIREDLTQKFFLYSFLQVAGKEERAGKFVLVVRWNKILRYIFILGSNGGKQNSY